MVLLYAKSTDPNILGLHHFFETSDFCNLLSMLVVCGVLTIVVFTVINSILLCIYL